MKQKLTKKGLSLLMCLVLLLEIIMPNFSFAETTTDTDTNNDTTTTRRTVMLGTSHINGEQADNIYFGRYPQDLLYTGRGLGANTEGLVQGADFEMFDYAADKDKNLTIEDDGYYLYGPWFYIQPIKWRVMNNDNDSDLNGTADSIYVMADKTLDTVAYRKGSLTEDGIEDEYAWNDLWCWSNSNLRTFLNSKDTWGSDYITSSTAGFYDIAFRGTAEQNSIATSKVSDTVEGYTFDKIFAPTRDELKTEWHSRVHSYTDFAMRDRTNPGAFQNKKYLARTADYWTERLYYHDRIHAMRNDTEQSERTSVYASTGVSPVMNLLKERIYLTSKPMEDGKEVKGDFSKLSDYNGSDWKLTIKDDNWNFAQDASFEIIGNTVTIKHKSWNELQSGIVYDDRPKSYEYTRITAGLVDENGELLYYGSINSDSTATVSTLTIPSELVGTNYSILVNAEIWSNRNWADRASSNPLLICQHYGGNATCEQAGVCELCGTEYQSQLNHEYKYAVDSEKNNVITEVCENGCNHSATATISVKENYSTVYKGGLPVEALEVKYSDNWKGDKNATLTYKNGNISVSTVTGSLTINGETATMAFDITQKSLADNDIKITLNPESATYNGEEHSPFINVNYEIDTDNTITLVKDNDYTIAWEKDKIQDVGEYTVNITGKGNYKESKTAKFNVNAASLSDVTVKQDGVLTYSGEEQEVKLSTNKLQANGQVITFKYKTEANGTYSTDIPKFKNAGKYTVYYELSAENHTSYEGTFEVTVEKQVVDVPQSIENKVYNGEVQYAEDVSDTELYTITKNDGATNVGETAIVEFELKDKNNYKWNVQGDPNAVTLSFEITQATNEWETEPSVENWTYGKEASVPTYKAKFGNDNVTISYRKANETTTSVTAPTLAGNYVMILSIQETNNYTGLKKEIEFCINKADYDLSSVKWDYSEAFKYDGTEKSVTLEGIPNGISVKSYNGDTGIDVGNYTASAELDYDADNYNKPIINNLDWEIVNNWNPTEYTTTQANENGWINKDFEVTAKEGYKISLTNTANGEWKDKLVDSVEGEDSSITFYLKNETTGEISLAKTEKYKLDKNTENTNSAGTVKFDELNKWEKFLNTITFDLFYNKEVKVKADAMDKLSGIDKIEYVESDKELKLEDVEKLTDWKKLDEDGVAVSVEDSKQFVYYLRITDKAGNITYISSDGAEYDTSAPSILGVENNKTYYSTQKVTIRDKNIDTITLNGEDETDTIILEGNKEATYTIEATDKVGNKSTVTVKIAKLDDITDVTPDDVTPEDKTELEDAKIELEKDLEENKDVMTEEEKNAIEDKIKDLEENLAIIENVESVEDLINNLPDKINKDDKEEVEEAKNAYDKLSDYEKNLLDPEIEDKLDKAIKSLEEVNNPQTSDNISLFMFMFVISALGIIFTTKFRKNYKK